MSLDLPQNLAKADQFERNALKMIDGYITIYDQLLGTANAKRNLMKGGVPSPT